MLQIGASQLQGWLGDWIWPFIRIGACLMVAPAFGARFVPPRIRIVLAAAIAWLVVPLLPPAPDVSPLSLPGLAILMEQVLIGIAIGFVLQVVFDAVGLAGQLLANSMGLSFAFNVDPLRGASTAAIGQFYVVLMLLTFFSLDGHLAVIQLLVDGFRTLPVGGPGLGAEGMLRVVAAGTTLFTGALSIALPGLTALTVANIAFGLISRAAPTLNIFSVGFPVTIVFGLVVVQVGLPGVQQCFIALLQQAFAEVAALQTPSAR
jgi:flagellar biosynthetic protein FliR